ncbi:MAG: BRCT domain-containing protein [Nitrosomonas sp.]|uniref:BRCT domain-containing protein n=1 Tax=Nitrosomonas sp. TaxID=42353 RepID=UPI0025D846D2|nr:BRCT domain-containing protein [Nitrosomonas sp.]MBY0474196.1 BRCT domain-containing protein [Nitrosomonas sp.]
MAYEGNDSAALKSIANRQLTKSMQTLLGICTGIAADNYISDNEVHFLNTWLTEYNSVSNVWPGSIISKRVRNILEDGIITDEDRHNLLDTLKQITGNHFTDTGSAQHETMKLPFDTPTLIFTQNIFCFTGEFVSGTRNYCKKITEQLGAMTADTMNKKVNYLVIGGIGSPAWVHESFGHKIAHAMRLKEKDHPILIIAEKHWIKSIQEIG